MSIYFYINAPVTVAFQYKANPYILIDFFSRF